MNTKKNNRVPHIVRIEPQKHLKIKIDAAKQGLTISDIINKLIDDYISNKN